MSDPFAGEGYYDLVFVGRGYSVSTYLLMADLSWCKRICIIAGPDAWSKVLRGEAGIINHALHVYGRQADKRAPEKETTSRKTLVDNNATIIDEAIKRLTGSGITVDVFPGLVTAVERHNLPLAQDAEINRGPADNPVFSLSWDENQQTIGTYKLTCNLLNQLPENSWAGITTTQNGQTITALKLVYGGGSGPHRVPTYLADLLGNNYSANDKMITIPETPDTTGGILGLDAFMRLSSAEKAANRLNFGQNKRLALIGPNAGLDAAMEAVDRGFELIYLFGHKTNMPFWLDTRHYQFENREDIEESAEDYVNSKIVRYDRKKTGGDYTEKHEGLIISKPDKYQIKLYQYPGNGNGDAAEETIENIDFIIYSIGQSPDFTEILRRMDTTTITARIGPARVLAPILCKEYLLPIYDVNKRFGDNSFETALGLQTEGTTKYRGLEVIGAAAFALTRGNDPVRKGPYVQHHPGNVTDTSVRDTMMALVKKIHREGAVVMPEQLGGVRSQIEALTGFDLMASVSINHALIPPCEKFLKAAQGFAGKLEKTNLADENKRAELIAASKAFRWNELSEAYVKITIYNIFSIGHYTKAMLDTLPQAERQKLKETDIESKTIGITTKEKLAILRNSLGELINFDFALGNKPASYDSLPDQIAAAQKWVTNVLTVMQQPKLLEAKVDFNGMDRNQLAVLLATRYSGILPKDWPSITKKIIEGRDPFPWGYTEDHVRQIKESLEEVNQNPGTANQFSVPSP